MTKKPTLAEALADHSSKRAAVEEAEAALEAAQRGKATAEAKTLDVPAEELDKAINVVVAATAKVTACERRLAVARERLVAARDALKEATQAELHAQLVQADEQLNAADAIVIDAAKASIETMREPLVNLHEARKTRMALAARLSEAGGAAPAEPSGPALRQLQMEEVRPGDVREAVRQGVRFDGPAVDVPATLTALVEYIQGEPAREAERAEAERRRLLAQEDAHRAAALRGDLGEAARQEMLKAEHEKAVKSGVFGKPSSELVASMRAPITLGEEG